MSRLSIGLGPGRVLLEVGVCMVLVQPMDKDRAKGSGRGLQRYVLMGTRPGTGSGSYKGRDAAWRRKSMKPKAPP